MILPVFISFLFLGGPGQYAQAFAGTGYTYQDSTVYQSYQGLVLDSRTREPIVFANVFLYGTNIGTVANSEGAFLIKVPMYIENKTLVISSIGYGNIEIPVSRLHPEDNEILLEPSPIPIKEVTIVNREARDLLTAALRNIPNNYSNRPIMVTTFYRETIRQNRSYVSVAEAVIDGYKSSYTNDIDADRLKIFKGRKSQDVKKMDTLLFKLQGGPQTMFMLDIVKNPLELLSEESMLNYNYQMGGIVSINERQAYVVRFNQRDYVDYPLYTGSFYIGVEDLSFMGAEFHLSENKLKEASQLLVRKKPIGLQVDVLGAHYLVRYRYVENNWYLNYVRSELTMSVRWKKKLFKSTYSTISEMAMTDFDPENITKFRFREITTKSDIFADQVSNFEDPDFWGEYNIIQPEEDIQTAINRIERKLRRRRED